MKKKVNKNEEKKLFEEVKDIALRITILNQKSKKILDDILALQFSDEYLESLDLTDATKLINKIENLQKMLDQYEDQLEHLHNIYDKVRIKVNAFYGKEIIRQLPKYERYNPENDSSDPADYWKN